jgi:hypothetical protein
VSFRRLLEPSAVFLVDLRVDKQVRDHRWITRAKQTTQEWRDMVDQTPEAPLMLTTGTSALTRPT